MENRVVALENFAVETRKFSDETRDRLTRIEVRMDTFVTKEYLHRELNSMTLKFVGFSMSGATALVAVVYWIARNVH